MLRKLILAGVLTGSTVLFGAEETPKDLLEKDNMIIMTENSPSAVTEINSSKSDVSLLPKETEKKADSHIPVVSGELKREENDSRAKEEAVANKIVEENVTEVKIADKELVVVPEKMQGKAEETSAEENIKPSGQLEVPTAKAGTSVKKTRKRPLKIEGKKMLPMRVLARPFSNIYKDKSIESGVVVSNVPALKPYYVYAKPTPEEIELEDGWYQVGVNTRGKIVGWMQAKDVLEWKQTMCLFYTHPGGRKPVLMFDKKSDLKKLLELPEEKRIQEAEKYYQAIETGKINKNFPIKSVEPKRAVDWKKDFYFLPILDFKSIEFGNREARLLKLTASTNTRADARETTDIQKNSDYLKKANIKSEKIQKSKIKNLKLDIVWVVDTTVSMHPYIDRTMKVIENISEKISNDNQTDAAIRFGIFGYRDNVEAIPKIGYTTKNYTPELVSVEQFKNVLKHVDVTKVDSVDYPEDMFSGMNKAINETSWRDDAMRFIILVGDAPSHKTGHPWNLSGQNEETLRSMADDKDISIYAIHIDNPKAKRFKELADRQFKTLATNTGIGEPAFIEVLSTDKAQFQAAALDIAGQFTENIHILKDLLQNNVALKKESPSSPQQSGELAFSDETIDIDNTILGDEKNTTQAKKLANAMFKAALVKWIGSHSDTKPPRDIVAWVVDKDLESPDIPSVEVRLLITKRQLDSLATTLDSIIKAGIKGQISGEDFFSSLQATTAMMARNPNMVRQAKRMTDYVPEFLVGLPYQSQLMAIDNELWESWSADEQMEFIDSMSAKVEAYRKIHDSPEGWIQVNPDDEPDEYIYPISLDLLP